MNTKFEWLNDFKCHYLVENTWKSVTWVTLFSVGARPRFLAPSCGGSGIPENKAFLNGAQMPNLYSALAAFALARPWKRQPVIFRKHSLIPAHIHYSDVLQKCKSFWTSEATARDARSTNFIRPCVHQCPGQCCRLPSGSRRPNGYHWQQSRLSFLPFGWAFGRTWLRYTAMSIWATRSKQDPIQVDKETACLVPTD